MFFKSKLLKYLVLILLVGVTLFIFFRSASRKEGFDAVQALKTRTDAIAKSTKEVADATNEYNNKKQFSCSNRRDCPNAFDSVNELKRRMESYSGELKKLQDGDNNSNTEEGKLSLDKLKEEVSKLEASAQTQALNKIPDLERRLSLLELVIKPTTITQT